MRRVRRSGGLPYCPEVPANPNVPFHIERAEERPGEWILTVTGELDSAETPELTVAVVQVLEKRPTQIMLDLSAVTFMDSSGLTALLWTAERFPDITLREPSRQVARLLDLAGVADSFRIEPKP